MIIAREEAHYDIISAMAHYARKNHELAHRFLDAIEDKIKNIEQYPQSYPIKIQNQYRRAILSNFPYSIYYKIELLLFTLSYPIKLIRKLYKRIYELMIDLK